MEPKHSHSDGAKCQECGVPSEFFVRSYSFMEEAPDLVFVSPVSRAIVDQYRKDIVWSRYGTRSFISRRWTTKKVNKIKLTMD
jgi:hypothetical protein